MAVKKCARALDLFIFKNWSEPFLSGRPDQTDRKQPNTINCLVKYDMTPDLGQHAVGVAQQEHDGQDGCYANRQSTGAIIGTHPEHDPTKHDQKHAGHVDLDQVVAQAPSHDERSLKGGEVT